MSESTLKTRLRLTAKTDVGIVRQHNEDNYVLCPDVKQKEWYFSDAIVEPDEGTLLVVADGMGGLNAGEVASAIAIETVQTYFNGEGRKPIESHEQVKDALFECINNAQSNMLNRAKEQPDTKGMGTTIVIALIKDNILHVAWVGDSRCYVLRKNTELYFATKDHSYVQELVDSGQLTMEQAFYHPESNIITRSLGDNSNKIPKPDFCSYPIESGDKILLCSDGLNGMLQDVALLKTLHDSESINQAALNLIKAANEAGGHDNITIILSEIVSIPNLPLPENIKLRKLEIAANLNQVDSGNPFQTLAPIVGQADEKGTAETPLHSDSNLSKKKIKWPLFISLVFIPIIIITILFAYKGNDPKIDVIKKEQVRDTIFKHNDIETSDTARKVPSIVNTAKKIPDTPKNAKTPETIGTGSSNSRAAIINATKKPDSIQKARKSVIEKMKEILDSSDSSK
jgi:serine/threonine protein phosphatase PrpC